MGIRQLAKFLKSKAPGAVSANKPEAYAGCPIAIDASLAIYQFLVAVRVQDGSSLGGTEGTTSHLVGMLYRTVRFVEAGITPVYVFDGPAPAMKAKELAKRAARREEAEQKREAAAEAADHVSAARYERRKVKVTPEQVAECQALLKLLGVPLVVAPSEAEAHCVLLCKRGEVAAVATEDMDALCFGTPRLLRNMNAAQSKHLDIEEYRLDVALRLLGFSMAMFIDMCILFGCDYTETLRGVGPHRAYSLIKTHGSIENALAAENITCPADFDFQSARDVFNTLSDASAESLLSSGEAGSAEETASQLRAESENRLKNGLSDAGKKESNPSQSETPETAVKKKAKSFALNYEAVQEEALIAFLCHERGFNPDRVKTAVGRLLATRKSKKQGKLSSFFITK